MKIILATSAFANTEPIVLGWLALMVLLILSAPVYLYLGLKKRLRRRKRPSASDLLK